jgi:hypothetical protein
VAPGTAIPIVRDDAIAGGFDPAHEALVEAAPVAEPGDERCWQQAGPEAARVVVSEYEEDRIRLRTGAPCAGVLVTSELAYPGWVARVDGRSAAPVVVNGAFRGLVVPAGDHAVELRYRPTLPWIARSIALACGLGLVGVAWRARGARSRAARGSGTGPC